MWAWGTCVLRVLSFDFDMMSIRVLACLVFVVGFSVFAWRNWFVSLCAAIVLMAVMEHPDMPNNIAGIQGLNLWNVLMLSVVAAWVSNRRQAGGAWDLPRQVGHLLIAYLAVVVLAGLRLLVDRQGYEADYPFTYIVSEHVINSVKWILPGLLLYDGCRSLPRVKLGMGVILLLYVLLALQVIRWMPLSFATGSGEDFAHRASKIIQNEMGYNRVTLSNMLGGASWGIFCAHVLFRRRVHQLGIVLLAATVSLGQALTGGRSGYASWAFVGFILCLVRWRWLLPIGVGLVAVVLSLLPGVRERLLQGVGGQQGSVVVQHDDYELTSGRTLAWPYVLRQIGESPVLGYGREAMVTTGLRDYLMEQYGESFPHPHNAYLQWLLDNGIVGFVPVALFFAVVLRRAVQLLLDQRDPWYTAAGGLASALVLALLVGSLGGQTFYPREGAVGLWAAMFLMLRVSVERERSLATGLPLFAQRAEDSPSPAADLEVVEGVRV